MRFFSVLAGEEGGLIVEVMVSAVLVALVATAVFKSIDGATATSGSQKSRATATTIAQQKQDELRAMDPTRLSNFSESKTVTNGGVAYTVVSSGVYVSDGTGAESCTASSTDKNADYIRITTTVTWPNIGAKKPVKATSIVTPRNGVFEGRGSAVIKVIDRDGQPEPGIPVSITSPDPISINTNSAGCAFFGNLEVGAKTGVISAPGYVDTGGNATINKTWTVAANTTVAYTYQYDQAAKVTVSFDTRVGNSVFASNADSVTFVNSNVPAPPTTGKRVFPISPSATSYQATTLFPFASGYTVYGGQCDANIAPQTPAPNLLPSIATNPGGVYAMTLRQPAINLKITRNNSSTLYSFAHVKITPSVAGCNGIDIPQVTTGPGSTPNGLIPNTAVQGLPYLSAAGSTYTVCVDDGSRRISTTVQSGTQTAGGSDRGTGTDAAGNITYTNLTIPVGTGSLAPCP